MAIFDFFRSKKNNASEHRDRNVSCSGRVGICDSPLNEEYTPEKIEFLGKRDIFVFGSNLAGNHAGGAARVALNRFGAIWGQGEGLQGNSYAIPTMQGDINTIKPYVDKFIEFAEYEKALTFYVTKIGCGIAGFKVEDIAPLFIKALSIDNIVLPQEFVEIAMNSQQKLINNDIVTHAHGVTRTFADIVIAMNEQRNFISAGEVMDFLKSYFDRLKNYGDDIAFLSIRTLWEILGDPIIFNNGKLDVNLLREKTSTVDTSTHELNKAYMLYCKEKICNVIATLNEFRRYNNPQQIIEDLECSTLSGFNHCGPSGPINWIFPIWGGNYYPLYYFSRFLEKNWSKVAPKGILEAELLNEFMFNRHERRVKEFGLQAVIERDYGLYACWSSYIPEELGTGPVYLQKENGYARSCGEGAGQNNIPNYLEYIIAMGFIREDNNYERIDNYYVPKYDMSLPIYEDYFAGEGRLMFNDLEEKQAFILQLKQSISNR